MGGDRRAMRWRTAVGLALALTSVSIAADLGRRGGGASWEGSLVLASGSNTAGNDEALTLGESMFDGKLITENAKLKNVISELKLMCGHKCKSKLNPVFGDAAQEVSTVVRDLGSGEGKRSRRKRRKRKGLIAQAFAVTKAAVKA